MPEKSPGKNPEKFPDKIPRSSGGLSNQRAADFSQARIRMARPSDEETYFHHLNRHLAESGDGDAVFHTIDKNENRDKEEFCQKLRANWSQPIDELGWERVWLLENANEIVGHIELRPGIYESSLHRVSLGMGLERSARGRGLGRRLAQTAIDWAKSRQRIAWLELWVFTHNSIAHHLYRSLGFNEIGIARDSFRVDGQSIDEIHMRLELSPLRVCSDTRPKSW